MATYKVMPQYSWPTNLPRHHYYAKNEAGKTVIIRKDDDEFVEVELERNRTHG
jgi:hypothetical protein